MSENRKVALVTGSGKGIGRAVAIALAKKGIDIAVNYSRSEEAALKTAEMIRKEGGECRVFRADVSKTEDVRALFEATKTSLGPVSILVNNAGITRDSLLIRMKDEDWREVLTLNLEAAFLCSREAVRDMAKARWGRIINVSSVVGIIGNPGQANYCASKAGLLGLTKSIAREYGMRGITANAVAPGWIETDMTASLKPEIREAMLKTVPAARPGLPEDVASVVAFLASDEASYVNGQTIAVDGGMTMV
ncbi:MAG: 3-oxoacyl-[acyl-carrier-protein] reductase [Synergistales bacterium]